MNTSSSLLVLLTVGFILIAGNLSAILMPPRLNDAVKVAFAADSATPVPSAAEPLFPGLPTP